LLLAGEANGWALTPENAHVFQEAKFSIEIQVEDEPEGVDRRDGVIEDILHLHTREIVGVENGELVFLGVAIAFPIDGRAVITLDNDDGRLSGLFQKDIHNFYHSGIDVSDLVAVPN
jgi:hypothetical protein